jgi:glycosyltransferase involved in cell wall biosynthesis
MSTGITVVVPSLNQGTFIGDALSSLLKQQYRNLEIIVQDGGSTDSTLAVLRSFGDQISWTSEPDSGQAEAIVKGFAKAKHDWITWLNSDDIQCDDALWKIEAAITANPSAVVVAGHGHYIDEAGNFLRPYPRVNLSKGADLPREFFEKGYIAQPSVFFRKAKYEAVGGLNVGLRYCMDYDLWARLAVSGARFVGIEDDISGNRWYEDTKTSGQLLELLSEVCATQIRLYRKISPYYIQGLSDLLYRRLYETHFGHANSLFVRTLFFKAIWLCLNFHQTGWWLNGLLRINIARAGPLVGDRIRNRDWFIEAFRALMQRRRPGNVSSHQ